MKTASEELKELAGRLDRILNKDNVLVIDVDFLELIRTFAKFCNRTACHPGFVVRDDYVLVNLGGEDDETS